MEKIKELSTKSTLKIFSVVVTILGGIGVAFMAYTHWRNEIWKPKVKVLDVDFGRGSANFEIGDKKIHLVGDSTVAIASDWGIRFGSNYNSDGRKFFDRIELVKKGLVYQTITSSDELLNSITQN